MKKKTSTAWFVVGVIVWTVIFWVGLVVLSSILFSAYVVYWSELAQTLYSFLLVAVVASAASYTGLRRFYLPTSPLRLASLVAGTYFLLVTLDVGAVVLQELPNHNAREWLLGATPVSAAIVITWLAMYFTLKEFGQVLPEDIAK